MDAPEPSTTPPLEIAHVLFMDIVEYSQLHMDRQHQALRELQATIRNTSEFARAQAADQLIRLPTGDGMALVFFGDPEAPVRCAIELTKILRNHPAIKLRIGIHTGPVYRVADINANRNVAGGGINIAQRVMDCGDAGHILVSGAEADVLGQVSFWSGMLHDLGQVEVKHGLRLHLYNLYIDEAGNPTLPKKLGTQIAAPTPVKPAAQKRKRPALIIGAVALLTLLSVAGWLLHVYRAHPLSSTDTIVLADFANNTGDPIFDETLRRGVAIQLKQSPFLSVVSGDRIQQALTAMHKLPDSLLTPELARELCRQTGSKVYLSGVIEGSSGPYVLGLKAVSCRTGSTLTDQRIQTATKEGVVRAISQASRKVREELGEPASLIQRFDISLDTAAPSLEALHAYALGCSAVEGRGHYPKMETRPIWRTEREQLVEVHNKAAVPFFQEAIRFDPNFAMAYESLARCYWNLESSVPATVNTQKAYELREQVGMRERFAIDGAYYYYRASFNAHNAYRLGVIPARLEKARQVFEDWALTYPRDGEPHRGLGEIYIEIGQYGKSLQEFRDALRLEPENADVCYLCMIQLHLDLNHLSEATAQLNEARVKDLSPLDLHWLLYELAFLKNDIPGMAQEVTWASTVGSPKVEIGFIRSEADTSAYHGKLGDAFKLLHRALESAKRSGSVSDAQDAVAHEAFLECLFNDLQECRLRAGAAFDDFGLESAYDEIAFALALGGETSRPEKYADKWEKQFAKEPQANLWLPLIRSQLWRNRKNPAEAIEILKAVTPYELTLSSGIYCVYIRGYANLAAPHLDDAEADFQELLDHFGILVNSPVGALARVGLARVRVSRGDMAAAKIAYEDFFKLWKDADPDIPILKQAKAEYAKLQ
jgi:class 3 adenylate cyclase/tetratricopeptide (TPR) repeat protein